MPGPGRKPAIEPTLRMPPRWRARLSTKASESSVSDRTLTSIIANCSSRSRELACPISPKPALLTMYCGSAPCAASASPITRAASLRCRSATITCGLAPPAAAISSASARNRSSRRATSAKAWPLRANTRARATPIPAEAPVITVTGRNPFIRFLSSSCNRPPEARAADHTSRLARLGDFGFETFQRPPCRFDAPEINRDDLNHHQGDHQPHHAGQLIARHQRADDERRDHRRAAAERIADAIGAQPDLGREQLRRVDAEQDRGLHIDRDDQDEADA